jgi:rhodanese-related sulfurtransferase
VGKMLAGGRGYTHVYHLEKGIKEWTEQGKALAPCGKC